jgi:uncharacterized protein (TIGR03067 family)
MTRFGCLAVALCLTGLACQGNDPSPAEKQPPAEKQSDKVSSAAERELLGDWLVLEMSSADWGSNSPKKEPVTAIFATGTLTLSQGGGYKRQKYSTYLNPTKQPKEMDLVLDLDIEDKLERMPGTKLHGIYELDGATKTLKLCWAKEGSRPKNFGSDQGQLLVLGKK